MLIDFHTVLRTSLQKELGSVEITGDPNISEPDKSSIQRFGPDSSKCFEIVDLLT